MKLIIQGKYSDQGVHAADTINVPSLSMNVIVQCAGRLYQQVLFQLLEHLRAVHQACPFFSAIISVASIEEYQLVALAKKGGLPFHLVPLYITGTRATRLINGAAAYLWHCGSHGDVLIMSPMTRFDLDSLRRVRSHNPGHIRAISVKTLPDFYPEDNDVIDTVYRIEQCVTQPKFTLPEQLFLLSQLCRAEAMMSTICDLRSTYGLVSPLSTPGSEGLATLAWQLKYYCPPSLSAQSILKYSVDSQFNDDASFRHDMAMAVQIISEIWAEQYDHQIFPFEIDFKFE